MVIQRTGSVAVLYPAVEPKRLAIPLQVED